MSITNILKHVFVLIMISLFITKQTLADTITCSYFTRLATTNDYREDLADEIADQKNTVALIFLGVIALASMNATTNYFYCTYKKDGMNDIDSAKYFFQKLQSGEIIPCLFYDGITSKFFKIPKIDDGGQDSINTPWSKTRSYFTDENGKNYKPSQYAFVFHGHTLKSTLRYFALTNIRENWSLAWGVDPKTRQFWNARPQDFGMMQQYNKE